MSENLFEYFALVHTGNTHRTMTVKACSMKVATEIILSICERTGETVCGNVGERCEPDAE